MNKILKLPLIAVATCIVVALSAAPVHAIDGEFELGDAAAQIGTADVAGSIEQPGPDWTDLFAEDADYRGGYRDAYDADGQPGANGVPDFIDNYFGQYAVFAGDDVSLGDDVDMTVRAGADLGLVDNGIVEADHDLGNVYFYSTHDADGQLVIFAATERLGAGDSYIEFEFNQAHVRLGRGAPWQITGERTPDDLLVRVSFAQNMLASVQVSRWAEIDGAGSGYLPAAELISEGCNAASGYETVCALCNAFDITSGSWTSFGSGGEPVADLAPGRLVEMGLNVGRLLGGPGVAEPAYTSIRITTPQDIAFAHWAEGN